MNWVLLIFGVLCIFCRRFFAKVAVRQNEAVYRRIYGRPLSERGYAIVFAFAGAGCIAFSVLRLLGVSR
jgi:hypothetical protein